MGMDAVVIIVRETFQMLAGIDVFIENAVVLRFQITLNVKTLLWSLLTCTRRLLSFGLLAQTEWGGAIQVGFDVLSVDWGNCTNEHCLLIEHTMINQVAFVGFVTAGGRL